jgi:uncharacterized protein
MTVHTKMIDAAGPVERERVLAALRQEVPRLRGLGITRLSLFGSMARGEIDSRSDVDLLVEIDPASHFSLFELVDSGSLGNSAWPPGAFRIRIEAAALAAGGDSLRGDLNLLMKHRHALRLRLEHILKGIARIEQLTVGNTVEDYLADEGLREMIERNIARISEAARFVPNDVRTRYTEVPWRRIVGSAT